MRLLPLLVALCPLAAQADHPLTAQAFEAHVQGKTITYTQGGMTFGIEEYLADRKVRWSVGPNLCQYGTWYPEGDNICFVYEDNPNRYCWTFWLRDGSLVALSVGSGLELHETTASDQGLPCPGPDVGV